MRMQHLRVFSVTLFVVSLVAVIPTLAQKAPQQTSSQEHPFGFDDWAALRSAQPVAVAPDGKTILYEVTFGGQKGTTNTEWRIIDASGSKSQKLNLPKEFSPRGFTKDGSHLYGTLEEKKQPAQFAIAGLKHGKPKPITNLPGGVRDAEISPDGSRFALMADPRTPDPLADVRTVVENNQTSIYVVNADGSGGAWWCGSLKDVGALSWSPDGQELAVLSVNPKIGFHDVHSTIDVCNANGARRVAEIHNAVNGIAWANAGKDIAFLSTTTDVLTPDHVWTVPAAGGPPVEDAAGLGEGAAEAVMGCAAGADGAAGDVGAAASHLRGCTSKNIDEQRKAPQLEAKCHAYFGLEAVPGCERRDGFRNPIRQIGAWPFMNNNFAGIVAEQKVPGDKEFCPAPEIKRCVLQWSTSERNSCACGRSSC